jgi:hypothetical protein
LKVRDRFASRKVSFGERGQITPEVAAQMFRSRA